MDNQCQFCGARYFSNEKTQSGQYNTCCNKGDIQIPLIATSEIPSFLMDLLWQNVTRSRQFRQNILQYNSEFTYISLGNILKVFYPSEAYTFRREFGPWCSQQRARNTPQSKRASC
jgi:hypothetical protein